MDKPYNYCEIIEFYDGEIRFHEDALADLRELKKSIITTGNVPEIKDYSVAGTPCDWVRVMVNKLQDSLDGEDE